VRRHIFKFGLSNKDLFIRTARWIRIQHYNRPVCLVKGRLSPLGLQNKTPAHLRLQLFIVNAKRERIRLDR